MMPLAFMSLAVSSSSLVKRALVFFLAVMSHLNQKFLLQPPRDLWRPRREPQGCGFPQRCQLIVVDVVQLVLGEAEQKHCTQLRADTDDHPVAASFALPRPRDPLLDQAAPEIGI